jgi:hypothetical protein
MINIVYNVVGSAQADASWVLDNRAFPRQVFTAGGNEIRSIATQKAKKTAFDRSVTVRSNWGWAFVFNKNVIGG